MSHERSEKSQAQSRDSLLISELQMDLKKVEQSPLDSTLMSPAPLHCYQHEQADWLPQIVNKAFSILASSMMAYAELKLTFQAQRDYAEQQQQFKVLHREKYLPLKETAALLNSQLTQSLQVAQDLRLPLQDILS